MKKRRWVAALLCVVMCCGMVFGAAAKDRKEHEKDYERVLFGNVLSKQQKDKLPKLTIIEEALYLAIDYFNSAEYGNTALDDLQGWKIKGLPKKTKKINFDDNSLHERRTHMGWDYTYYEKKAKWSEIRKPLLIASVNSALEFESSWINRIDVLGWFAKNEELYSKQCVSFSALLYYIHILGDHEKNSIRTWGTRIPLGRSNVGSTNRDIMYDLLEHLPILFKNQSGSIEYKSLMRELTDKAEQIRGLDMSTKEALLANQEVYKSYAKEVIDILAEHVPNLLKNEPFFANVFYK